MVYMVLYGFIWILFDSFEILQNLLLIESKEIMLFGLEFKKDFECRNERFLTDNP